MKLHYVRLAEEPGLTAARTADHQHVFIAGVLGTGWAAVHRKGFRRRQNNIVFWLWIDVRLNVFFRAPGSVLSTVNKSLWTQL